MVKLVKVEPVFKAESSLLANLEDGVYQNELGTVVLKKGDIVLRLYHNGSGVGDKILDVLSNRRDHYGLFTWRKLVKGTKIQMEVA